ncbi:LysR substrate-binding domain-containing protein [Zavarzinia aquatilis]|uniref:LysR family transcriptional regulator n=1 Tax=Zavarzinia aquatilis TaxID=2211142 RepID=A0A317DV38_9PROT|nr:LysR substrate-binding domain-containing protein [Zavarzinia aquatilis]PWR18431.1 LysR family transcriptional regulator [Zavarzinia aquatilis]
MSRSLPPLNAARAFEAAFRHQSFARAAEELNVAPAAVSRHVRDLEIWLGLALFERHSRGIALTDAGRRLGAALAPAFEAMAAAFEAERPATPTQRVTVTVEPVFAQRWLLRRLAEFRALAPEVELVLAPGDRLADLKAEGIDLGIRYGRGGWPHAEAELLTMVEVYPVACPAIAAQLPAEPGVEDLRRFTLLHEDGELWPRWGRFTGGEVSATAPSGLMLHDTHLAIEAAALGQGIALGDSVLDFDDRAAGRLIRLTRAVLQDHGYWLVSPPRRRPAPAVRRFRDWLRARLRADMEEAARLPVHQGPAPAQ